jgi:uncharacterized membrane protein YqaE (UPF0057 family)
MKKLVMYALMLVMSMGLAKQSVAIGLVSTNNQTIAVATTEVKKEAPAKIAGDSGISKTVYIILSIFSLGWLAIGLNDNWKGSKWIIALVCYFLLWLPGVIYSLMHMKDYYK